MQEFGDRQIADWKFRRFVYVIKLETIGICKIGRNSQQIADLSGHIKCYCLEFDNFSYTEIRIA